MAEKGKMNVEQVHVRRDEYMEHLMRLIDAYRQAEDKTPIPEDKKYYYGCKIGLVHALDAYVLVTQLGPVFEEEMENKVCVVTQ